MPNGLGERFVGDDTLSAKSAVEIEDIEQWPSGSGDQLRKGYAETADYGGYRLRDVEPAQMSDPLATPCE